MPNAMLISQTLAVKVFDDARHIADRLRKPCAAYLVGMSHDIAFTAPTDLHLSTTDICDTRGAYELCHERLSRPNSSMTPYVDSDTLDYALGLAQQDADELGRPILTLVVGATRNGTLVQVLLATDVDVNIEAICEGINLLPPIDSRPGAYHFINYTVPMMRL